MAMTMARILKDLWLKPTVPLWPTYGAVYDVGRATAYKEAAEGLRRGDAEFLRKGKVIRLVTAVTRKRVGLDADPRVPEQQERGASHQQPFPDNRP